MPLQNKSSSFKTLARRNIMTRLVKVLVVDEDGNGLYGEKVNLYDCPIQRTNKDGIVSLTVEDGDVDIYINGFSAYSGSSSKLGKVEAFTTSGGRP